MAPTPPTTDWSDPHHSAAALGAVSQALMQAKPRAGISGTEKFVCFVLVIGVGLLAVYLLVQAKKDTKRPASTVWAKEPAPRLTTGDVYWDRILGYSGASA